MWWYLGERVYMFERVYTMFVVHCSFSCKIVPDCSQVCLVCPLSLLYIVLFPLFLVSHWMDVSCMPLFSMIPCSQCPMVLCYCFVSLLQHLALRSTFLPSGRAFLWGPHLWVFRIIMLNSFSGQIAYYPVSDLTKRTTQNSTPSVLEGHFVNSWRVCFNYEKPYTMHPNLWLPWSLSTTDLNGHP